MNSLEAPIVYQPDTDFHSVDGVIEKGPESWLEMPLRTDRPVPFRCAVSDYCLPLWDRTLTSRSPSDHPPHKCDILSFQLYFIFRGVHHDTAVAEPCAGDCLGRDDLRIPPAPGDIERVLRAPAHTSAHAQLDRR